MAYEKQTWVTGEVITKEKLNHMEDGIANGGSSYFRVNVTSANFNYTLDKTWAEIKNAVDSGMIVMPVDADEAGTDFQYLFYIGYDDLEDVYVVSTVRFLGPTPTNLEFTTSDPDGYPTTDLSNH